MGRGWAPKAPLKNPQRAPQSTLTPRPQRHTRPPQSRCQHRSDPGPYASAPPNLPHANASALHPKPIGKKERKAKSPGKCKKSRKNARKQRKHKYSRKPTNTGEKPIPTPESHRATRPPQSIPKATCPPQSIPKATSTRGAQLTAGGCRRTRAPAHSDGEVARSVAWEVTRGCRSASPPARTNKVGPQVLGDPPPPPTEGP